MKARKEEELPPAVILAGGLGTRLREVYSSGPKCLAPVAGRPFLDYVLKWLSSEGVKRVVLCVGYKKTSIRRYVGAGRKWGLRVTYSVERRLLGTGGAVKKAGSLISGSKMLVINGDSLVRCELRKLVEFHQRRRASASVVFAKVHDSTRYGSIELDGRGRIVAFLEKTRMDSRSSHAEAQSINAGVYVLEKGALQGIRAGRRASLERDVFPALAASGKVYGLGTNGYFIDIGIPEDLRRAQDELREW